MTKTCTVILPLPKAVSVEGLIAIAEHAGKLSKTIRDWLPVEGDSVTKTANPRTAEDCFSQAAKHYEECELIRNPDYVPFTGRGIIMERGYSAGVYSNAVLYWSQLLVTLDELAVLYHWEGISDHSGAHGWNWWGEDPIPSADPNTLDRLERIISGLKTVATEIKCSEAKGSALSVPEVAASGDTTTPHQRRMPPDVANENLKALLENGPERYLEMNQTELAKAVGCCRGTLGKTPAYRVTIPNLLKKHRQKRR